MSILISGLNKLNITKSNNKNELDQPSNGELIKKLNYEELEKNYEIHKYYPQFIHNQGISTPTIKELIIDKPIYSKANEHIEGWKNPGTRKALITELDIETGELKRYEQPDKDQRKDRREERRERREERREDRKDRREERREDRKDRREDRRERREDRREDRHERREELREHRHERREELREHRHERKEVRRRRKREPHGLFTNQLTMPSVYERYRSSSEESLRLARNQTSYSYDATKSNMTNKRSNKWKFKFNERRLSEQLEVITENVNNGHTGQLQQIQYTQSQMVGHGSFGVVFQTQILPSNEIAAIKRVLQDKRFKNRELQIMKLIHHRNIVDLKYYFYTNNDKQELYLNLILEFVPETLYKASHYYVSKRLSMPQLEVKLYTYQMLRALNYIHSQGICHRDIKPQNLLINSETGELKLCDFGSAKILNPNEPNVAYICSRYYRAPELIFGATNYTTKIDVWSAGCVMAELILGQPLFPGESGIDQLVEIIKILGTPSKEQIKNMNPNYMEHKFPQIKPIPLTKIFKKMSNDCIQFLIKILQYSPIDRISCIEALSDEYFDELRNSNTKLPNYRKLFSQQYYSSDSNHSNNANYQLYSNQPDIRNLPELFDFDDRELSVMPQLNSKLIPAFAMNHLKWSRFNDINDINSFIPLNSDELKVTLD